MLDDKDDDTRSNGYSTLSESSFINNDDIYYVAKRKALPKPQTSSSLQQSNGTPQQRQLPQLGLFSVTPTILTVQTPQRRADHGVQHRGPKYGDGNDNSYNDCQILPGPSKVRGRRGHAQFSAVEEQEAMKEVERRMLAMQNGSTQDRQTMNADVPRVIETQQTTATSRIHPEVPRNIDAQPNTGASRIHSDVSRNINTQSYTAPSSIQPDVPRNTGTQPITAASHILLDVQTGIGAEYIRFLPKYPEIKYDECTNLDQHLPIIVRVGTYIPAAPLGESLPQRSPTKKRKGRPLTSPTKPNKKAKKADKFNDKLEIWAHHTILKEPKIGEAKPVTPLELLAYDEDEQNVPDVPGLAIGEPWEVTRKHVRFLPAFKDVGSTAELRCIVRYCLHLAAAHGLHDLDGSSIPKDIGFGRVLIEYCKRKWNDERFQVLEQTGVLPDESDLRKGVAKLNVPKAEDVEQFSASESEGEDEIPAVMPEGWTHHLEKEKREPPAPAPEAEDIS